MGTLSKQDSLEVIPTLKPDDTRIPFGSVIQCSKGMRRLAETHDGLAERLPGRTVDDSAGDPHSALHGDVEAQRTGPAIFRDRDPGSQVIPWRCSLHRDRG